MYSRRGRQLEVVKMVKFYWLHRINKWECFPVMQKDIYEGPITRHTISLPKIDIMDSSPDRYDVFSFDECSTIQKGLIFRRAAVTGHFTNIDIDDAKIQGFVSKYMF